MYASVDSAKVLLAKLWTLVNFCPIFITFSCSTRISFPVAICCSRASWVISSALMAVSWACLAMLAISLACSSCLELETKLKSAFLVSGRTKNSRIRMFYLSASCLASLAILDIFWLSSPNFLAWSLARFRASLPWLLRSFRACCKEFYYKNPIGYFQINHFLCSTFVVSMVPLVCYISP